jgi:thiol-disulfide isomerase/thioredoxin
MAQILPLLLDTYAAPPRDEVNQGQSTVTEVGMRGRGPFLVLAVLALAWPVYAVEQAKAVEPPKLLGKCTVQQIDEPPFSEWFHKGYEEYRPNPAVLESLRDVDRQDVTLALFFGTWCGDSRYHVPHLVKLLDEMGFPRERVELIGVDAVEGQQKRSPGGEEVGLEIYRVPTLIVRRAGKEVARVVEFPVLSLERDLLAILSGNPPEPNYRSYPVVRRWRESGLLGDKNVSAWGLAGEVRGLVSGEEELGAAAEVLLDRGEVAEAVKLFEANCALFRESARCQARLAEGRLRAGDVEAAREAAERALRLNTSPDRVADLVALLGRCGSKS